MEGSVNDAIILYSQRALDNAHQPLEAIEGTKLDQLLKFCTNAEQLPVTNEVIEHAELRNYADQVRFRFHGKVQLDDYFFSRFFRTF